MPASPSPSPSPSSPSPTPISIHCAAEVRSRAITVGFPRVGLLGLLGLLAGGVALAVPSSGGAVEPAGGAPPVPASPLELPPAEAGFSPPPLPPQPPEPRRYGDRGTPELALGLGYSSSAGLLAAGGFRYFVIDGVAPGIEGTYVSGGAAARPMACSSRGCAWFRCGHPRWRSC